MKRQKLVAVAAVAALVGTFGLASVGTAGAKVASQSSVRGVTSTSIKVAGICDTTGVGAAAGAKARFDAENAKGGTLGRKWDFQSECNNDSDDANQDLTIGKRLVQQDGVFGVVPVQTPTLASAPFFAQQKVPFAGWGISTGFCKNPYAAAFTGCIVPPTNIKTTGTTWGALVDGLFKKQGSSAKGKTAAVITEDDDSGKVGAVVVGAQAKVNGMKLVYAKAALPPPTQTVGDYTPYVQALMTSASGKAPDVIFVTTAFANVLGLSGALLQAGYKGILTNAVAYDPALIKAATGQSVFTQFDLPEDTSNANMVQIVKDMNNGGVPTNKIGQPALAGYFAADMFIAVTKKAGKNLTPDSWAKALSKFTYQIKGVVGPTKYPQSQTQGAPCGTLVTSNGTAYEISVPYACYKNINYTTLKPIKY
ncbi:MAG TPA: ABC transporter substrate-binding protein [Acidimicrobiia bacterium]|nr:ABC transporter substrate-binding protein [Acidimicrobiia bacterium]